MEPSIWNDIAYSILYATFARHQTITIHNPLSIILCSLVYRWIKVAEENNETCLIEDPGSNGSLMYPMGWIGVDGYFQERIPKAVSDEIAFIHDLET